MSETGTSPGEFVRIEAEALLAVAQRIEGSMQPAFARAVELLAACADSRRRVIVTGMGKSGLIGQKIAATLNSTGTPAQFLHPAEAIHGDLGMVGEGDVVVALSYSGESEELSRLLDVLKRLADGLIGLCGKVDSSLGRACDVVLDCSVDREACPLGLAPTASTTVMLAVGDALAMEVGHRRGFRVENFADLHPGGTLGKRLMRISQLMRAGDGIPMVSPTTLMPDVIHEMSRRRLGMTTVVENGRLLGVLSDGDLRRLIEREEGAALQRTAGEVMNRAPITIGADAMAIHALALMEERKITALVVVGSSEQVEGVVHLHDLWSLELA